MTGFPMPRPPLLLFACLTVLLLSACDSADEPAPPAPVAHPVAAPTSSSPEQDGAPATVADTGETAAPAPKRYVPYAGQWPTPDKVERDGPDAELLVQFGDIDNFGFGFARDYDPFSGRSTRPHPYPFEPDSHDAPGTDRIMVVSGFVVRDKFDRKRVRKDGYTNRSERPHNLPIPLRLAFDPAGIEIRAAALQLFVDDFQPKNFESRYHFRINGRDLPAAAATLNKLDQTGPVGKLLTIQLLPEQFDLLAGGRVEIDIDDPVTDVGDGFAFDFVRLLINPKQWANTGTIQGRVTDRSTRTPLAGVLVTASNTRHATTGADGRYRLEDVPAGLAVVGASHPDYLPASASKDLVAKAELQIDLALEPNPHTRDSLGDQLDANGSIDLYGIRFDTDQATLKPESTAVLEQVLALLQERSDLQVAIAGHTDAEGDDAHNLALSQRRAAAVVDWLAAHGIAATRMRAEGHGESAPVASNATAEGRALNRRVEIKDAKR
jgi:OmpA-OmpF porin, OOP family